MGHNEDIDSFIRTFEKICQLNSIPREIWANKLAPLLTGKAKAIYSNMSLNDCRSYERIKEVLLERFMLSPEAYRKKFRTWERSPKESYTEWVAEITDHAKRWLEGKDAFENPNRLFDILILEQIFEIIPKDMKIWLLDREPKTPSEAAQLADQFIGSRREHRETKLVIHRQTGQRYVRENVPGRGRNSEVGNHRSDKDLSLIHI